MEFTQEEVAYILKALSDLITKDWEPLARVAEVIEGGQYAIVGDSEPLFKTLESSAFAEKLTERFALLVEDTGSREEILEELRGNMEVTGRVAKVLNQYLVDVSR